MLKENKGITLIALIITIIIVIIIGAIGVKAGRDSIRAGKDNRLLTELDMVQHAVMERYTKYKLTNNENDLVGTRLAYSTAKSVADEMKVNLPEQLTYYELNDSDLKNLGLETSDFTYIVNYPNGIVMNSEEKFTNSGDALYTDIGVIKIATETTDNYVKNGLILHYDGINNTGSGHSNSTNTWYDLSGNGHHGTVHGIGGSAESGWHDDHIALDGIDDYVENQNITVDGANGTVEIVAKIISSKSGYMFRSNASGERTYIRQRVTHKGNPAVGIDFKTDTVDKASRVLKWYTTNNTSYCSNYYNNIKSEEKTFTSTENGTYISIGSFRADRADELEKEDVYAVRVYNRALTDEEVAQNYNEDKARFGI